MSQNFRRHSCSFVLRFWSDSQEDSPEWRGQLERVGGQEKIYFNDSQGLLEALARWIPEFIPTDNPKEEYHVG